jgi:hypothetical protein
MPDTDARLARLYDSLTGPAAGSRRAPRPLRVFGALLGSIWPYLTQSERLFSSAPPSSSRRRTALCTASQCGDQLERGGRFEPHLAGLRCLRPSAGNARRQSRQGSAAIGFTAANGHAARPPSAAMNSRRFIRPPCQRQRCWSLDANSFGGLQADDSSTRFLPDAPSAGSRRAAETPGKFPLPYQHHPQPERIIPPDC